MLLIDKQTLTKALTLVSKASSNKPTIPILTNIYLELKNSLLTVACSDLEMGIKATLKVDTDYEFVTTVNTKLFSDFLMSLPNSTIEVELDSTLLKLRNDISKAEFTTIDPKDFPKIPEISDLEQVFELDSKFFIEAIDRTYFAAASEAGARPVLTGILLEEIDSKLTFIGLDGFRMSKKVINTISVTKGLRLIIPARVLNEVSKTLSMFNEDLIIKAYIKKKDDRAVQILFVMDNVIYSSRLLDGVFPDYKAIIPTEINCKYSFSKDEFLLNLKVVDTFARNIIGSRVTFEIDKNSNTLVLSANDPERGNSNSRVLLNELEIENYRSGFNSKYVIDMINHMGEGEIMVKSKGPVLPTIFEDGTDPNYLHIIMPMRVE